jgi:hypothetical protein
MAQTGSRSSALSWRSSRSAAFLLLTLSGSIGACAKRSSSVEMPAPVTGQVVATVDGRPIMLSSLSGGGLGGGANLNERRRELESVVRFEVMANEALQKGYDKDPDVMRAIKQQLINKLVKDNSSLATESVSENSIEVYFKAHSDDFKGELFSDVRPQIQARLASEGRARKMDEWTQALLARHKVEIFDDVLRASSAQ